MPNIRCPHCGSPVMIRGSRWECGYCCDFGSISSLHPSEKAKLMQSATPTIQVTITASDTSGEKEARTKMRADVSFAQKRGVYRRFQTLKVR